jgi:membrane-associated protein
MDTLIAFFSQHAPHAHFFIFLAILLAGVNIPISIDLLLLLSALLAANVVPENTALLFLSVLLGSI